MKLYLVLGFIVFIVTAFAAAANYIDSNAIARVEGQRLRAAMEVQKESRQLTAELVEEAREELEQERLDKDAKIAELRADVANKLRTRDALIDAMKQAGEESELCTPGCRLK